MSNATLVSYLLSQNITVSKKDSREIVRRLAGDDSYARIFMETRSFISEHFSLSVETHLALEEGSLWAYLLLPPGIDSFVFIEEFEAEYWCKQPSEDLLRIHFAAHNWEASSGT